MDVNYWVKPCRTCRTMPKFSTPVDGCPDDCGLYADHEQHTCSPIIEISNKCDLECPICVVWNQKLQYN